MIQKNSTPVGTADKFAKKDETAPKSKKRLWFIVIAFIILVFGGITAAILLYRPTPPDPKTNPDNAKKFLASKNFKRLDASQKLAYLSAFGNDRSMFRPSDDMTDAQKNQLRENMRALFEAQMKERMKKFFAASIEEQNKMLDEDIKRDAEREKQMQQNGGPGGGPPGGWPGGGPGGKGGTPPSPPSAQEQRNREASANPAMHGQMQVYMTMKQQRKSGQR